MARRGLPWLLSLPLMAVACLTAHSLAYRLVASGPADHERVLAESGHGYQPVLPHVLGLLLALALAGAVRAGLRAGTHAAGSPPWLFASLPPLAFTVQEHLERLAHGADAAVVLEPAFLLGLVLQLPFALAGLLLGRVVLYTAGALAARIGPRRFARRFGPHALGRPREAGTAQRLRGLALCQSERAPPAAS